AENVIIVRSAGKFGIDLVVIFAVERIVEPDFSFLDRSGEGEARQELVESPSMPVDERGDEVGGIKAEVVVPDAGIEQEQPGGAFAGFCRLPGRLHLDGSEGVGADAQQQQSVGRLRNVKAVENRLGLVGLGSGDVGLSVLVLNYASDEVDGVTETVGGRENNVNDVESGKCLPGGHLRRIDRRSGFANVDDFPDFLQMIQGDLQG